MKSEAGDLANQQLVDRLIAEGALWSPALLAAFRATPRHRFLDRIYLLEGGGADWRELSTERLGRAELRAIYSDRALITRLHRPTEGRSAVPVSSSSQPSLMARMLEDMKLRPGLRVLEIGAGTGYNAALMAHVVGPGGVVSVDVDRTVLAGASDHLRQFSDRQVLLRHADGREGCAELAPFDRIIVTAATPDLEPAWLDQLSERGLLQAPMDLAPGLAFLVVGRAEEGVFHGRLTRAAYFMSLRDEEGSGLEGTPEVPSAMTLRVEPAPWAGWFRRKPTAAAWQTFIQSLAFYAWLNGFTVYYRNSPTGPSYGLSIPGVKGFCWLRAGDWQVDGEAGLDMAEKLWRSFLDVGGPWPSEFELTATPRGMASPPRLGGYTRQGPRCQHHWRLLEERDRPF